MQQQWNAIKACTIKAKTLLACGVLFSPLGGSPSETSTAASAVEDIFSAETQVGEQTFSRTQVS